MIGHTAAQSGLFPRVERGFLAGSLAAAATMGVLLAARMEKGIGVSADELIEASHDLPIEP